MKSLHDIARECAPLINGRWRYLENEAWHDHTQRAYLQDDSQLGRKIIFTDYYCGQGRIKIFGSNVGKRHVRGKITVSQNRNPRAIAADINRRFLTDFLKRWDKAHAENLAEQERLDDLKNRVDLVRKIDPSLRASWHSGGEATDYYLNAGKLRLSAFYPDEAYLDVKIPYDKLIRILQILNEDQESPK